MCTLLTVHQVLLCDLYIVVYFMFTIILISIFPDEKRQTENVRCLSKVINLGSNRRRIQFLVFLL
jgi:hypothetical protein